MGMAKEYFNLVIKYLWGCIGGVSSVDYRLSLLQRTVANQ